MAHRIVPLLWVLSCLAARASPLKAAADSGALAGLDRYSRTLTLLARGPASAADSLLLAGLPDAREAAAFLQAEAFFLYRPAMRSPGPLSLAAQALAASTDFAPLVVWTASTDANGLRMLGYDGAVMGYERFLARFPTSALAPFALYRLAWAYRSVSLDIFPRDADSCSRELIARFPGSPFGRWADGLAQVPYKSQQTAAAWSLLPGAGQIYIGKPVAGMVRFGIAAGFAAMALIPPIFMIRDRELDWQGVILSGIGFVGLQVSYTLAFQDAQRGAIRFNERQEKRFLADHPDTP